ncbi:GNAT family N-acetyltransferase [Heyndrickxia sporothermodurans]
MTAFEVRRIQNLLEMDISLLVKESKEEGFRFLGRLVDEYKDGTNQFIYRGEALYGVFNEEGILIAIGGLNQDPYSNESSIGRVRRFYVSKAFRKNGVGRLLLERIISEARKHYRAIVLHTDMTQADQFYTSLGFVKKSNLKHATHYLKL